MGCCTSCLGQNQDQELNSLIMGDLDLQIPFILRAMLAEIAKTVQHVLFMLTHSHTTKFWTRPN